MNHFESVKNLLDNAGIVYQIFDHPQFANTDEAISFVPEVNSNNAIKSLLFRYGEHYILCLLRVCDKLDKAKVQQLLGISEKLIFTSPDETLSVSGCIVGTLSPFCGLTANIATLCDSNVASETVMFCTPGTLVNTLQLSVADFLTLANPSVVDIHIS
jgi:prolyl-tRNA editing enzyme YbaK/EbsC (Cys-tRNA(Pro) deacylase)